MGLDMFLMAKKTLWDCEVDVGKISQNDKLSGFNVDKIIFEVGYWRKANAIHRWFVKNVQDGVDDCRSYEVTDYHLNELLDLCKKVKADPSLGEKLLPTIEGFFFGSTDYDDFYLQDIEDTIKIIEKVQSIYEQIDSLQYMSSW